MAQRKPSRKELLKSPDEFLTLTQRARDYVLKHRERFIYGAAALVCVVVLILGINWYLTYREGLALDAYARASAQIPEDGFNPVQAEKAAAALEVFLDEYSGSDQAPYARLELADLYFALDRFAEAQKAYQTFLDDAPADAENMRPFVLDALAKTYEAQDKYAQAEAAWTSIIQLPGGMLKAEAHLSLGRIYEAQGDEARAQAEYELVTEKFGDSPGARLAAAKLHK